MHKKRLLWVCVVALAARLAIANLFPNVHHPDETFQYLEQAYRATTGRGLIPWEYVAGVRSWVLPGLLIPVIAAARLFSTSPAFILFAIGFAASVVSLGAVISAYVLGRRVGGDAAGLTAAIIAALWPEIVLMSPHILADTVSAVPLIAAFAVGYRPGSNPPISFPAMAVTGFLLCLALLLRPQLVPAIACAGLWIAGYDARHYRAMVLGALPMLAIFGLVDWVTWGAPFVSAIRYAQANGGGVADQFGVKPFYYYPAYELLIWRGGIAVITVTALFGARRLPLLALTSFLIMLTFSCVGHKEYRFIYPAIPLLFTLCGVGTVEIIGWLAKKGFHFRKKTLVISQIVIWTGTAAMASSSPSYISKLRNGRSTLAAIGQINADPGVCGVAVVPAERWYQTGAIRFRPDLPLYVAKTPVEGPQAYNAILLMDDNGRATPFTEAGFRLVGCKHGDTNACYLRRSSSCHRELGAPLRADPSPALTSILRRMELISR